MTVPDDSIGGGAPESAAPAGARPPWNRPEQRAASPAMYDRTTLLPNEALLLDRLSMALTRTHRSGEPLAIVLCRMQGLSDLVARFGELGCTEALTAIAHRLQHSVRTADSVARRENDEFILLCEGLARSEDITLVFDRIHQSMQDALTVNGEAVVLPVSIGAVITNDPMLEFDELFFEAEDRLDDAAEQGPGSYAISDWSFKIFGDAAALLHHRKQS